MLLFYFPKTLPDSFESAHTYIDMYVCMHMDMCEPMAGKQVIIRRQERAGKKTKPEATNSCMFLFDADQKFLYTHTYNTSVFVFPYIHVVCFRYAFAFAA